MKTLLQLTICLLFANFLFSQCPVPTIIYPNGNEVFSPDSVLDVKVDYNPYPGFNAERSQLFYSTDGGNTWIFSDTILIDTNALFDNPVVTFQWTVPDIASNNCLLRFHKYETLSCYDMSDNTFTISPVISAVSQGFKTENDFVVFPNPALAGEELTVKSGSIQNSVDLQLMDRNGKLIREYLSVDTEVGITTGNMLPGLYYLLIKSDKEVIIEKLILR